MENHRACLRAEGGGFNCLSKASFEAAPKRVLQALRFGILVAEILLYLLKSLWRFMKELLLGWSS